MNIAWLDLASVQRISRLVRIQPLDRTFAPYCHYGEKSKFCHCKGAKLRGCEYLQAIVMPRMFQNVGHDTCNRASIFAKFVKHTPNYFFAVTESVIHPFYGLVIRILMSRQRTLGNRATVDQFDYRLQDTATSRS
jgi:hypothetical protein